MQNFVFYAPTEIVFGRNAEDSTAALVKKHGGRRVLLVYGGGSAVKSGLIDKIKSQLADADIPTTLFGGAQPNPLLCHAREGVRAALDNQVDFILAVGGGSAIDTAKAIGHGAANPDTDIWKFWLREVPLATTLPLGVVLTIPAAGSETSNSAVITNAETKEKRGLATDFNRPYFAVMNPELALTLPPYHLACGIVDILMHTLDRYFTKIEGNETTDAIAEALMRVIYKNGTAAMADPTDYHAMSELMWCGSLSHNTLTGLGTVLDFSVHGLGHELSGKFDLAHGASLSTMWGAWATFAYKDKPERFAQYARNVWGIGETCAEAAALKGIDATLAYFTSIHMPTKFSETPFGVQPEAVIDDLANRCTFYETRTVGQFIPLDRAKCYAVYKLANH
jgi:hypothetical protein